jgi:hypothetical protein
MIFNIQEIVKPQHPNKLFYTIEKSMYGGYVIYVELESDLKDSGTLDSDNKLKHHWKPLPPGDFDPDQLELKFNDHS